MAKEKEEKEEKGEKEEKEEEKTPRKKGKEKGKRETKKGKSPKKGVEKKENEKKKEKEEEKEEEKGEEKEEGKGKKGKTEKFILFVGNLSYGATQQSVSRIFRCVGKEKLMDVRIMTHKDTGKSKGCAFVEFSDAASLNKALMLHHTIVDGRKINVELTAGGGGKSQQRTKKLNQKNRRLKVKRVQTFEQKIKPKKTKGPEKKAP